MLPGSYSIFDADSLQGWLSFDDFRKTVRRAGISPGVLSDDELQRIVEIVDSDGRYRHLQPARPSRLNATPPCARQRPDRLGRVSSLHATHVGARRQVHRLLVDAARQQHGPPPAEPRQPRGRVRHRRQLLHPHGRDRRHRLELRRGPARRGVGRVRAPAGLLEHLYCRPPGQASGSHKACSSSPAECAMHS